MTGARIHIDRLAIRLEGVSEREARALSRTLGPALETRLAALGLDGAAGSARLARLDAGRIPAAGGARGVAEAVGRSLEGRLGARKRGT